MGAVRAMAWIGGAVSALALLACAAEARLPRRASAVALPSVGTFTPSAADPRRASILPPGFGDTGFHFTPSAAPGRSRAVTVAVRTRAVTRTAGDHAAATMTAAAMSPAAGAAIAPNVYNLGLAVGWKRFALSGDYVRAEGALLPVDREGVDLGLSYASKRWSTRIQLGADRSIGNRPQLIGSDQSYSVDLGGSYAVSRNIDLTGGVRYKSQRERFAPFAVDDRRDSQSVYIGTAFRF